MARTAKKSQSTNDANLGWEQKPLSDLLKIIGGGTSKTTVSEYWGGEIPWFSVVDAPSVSDVYVVKTEKKITREGLESSSARLLPEGTTIITARGTVGKIALVGVPMAMNQSCYGITGRKNIPSLFTYFLLRSVVQGLQSHTHGSVFDTIRRDTFNSVDGIVPAGNLHHIFEQLASPLLRRINSNVHESTTLVQLRDLLLPKLMSGEIRLKDADKAGAEVA